MELIGRVALVTGGAGGIGGAVVRCLAKSGIAGVAINYRKSAKEAEDLAAEIERSGVKAVAVQADVQIDQQVRAMTGMINDEFGRLDILEIGLSSRSWVSMGGILRARRAAAGLRACLWMFASRCKYEGWPGRGQR